MVRVKVLLCPCYPSPKLAQYHTEKDLLDMSFLQLGKKRPRHISNFSSVLILKYPLISCLTWSRGELGLVDHMKREKGPGLTETWAHGCCSSQQKPCAPTSSLDNQSSFQQHCYSKECPQQALPNQGAQLLSN